MPRDRDDDHDDDDTPIPRSKRRREEPDDDDYEDDEDDYDRRRRRREEGMDGAALIVPTNVSALAIISCYTGLIGFCLPLIGLPFAILAVICGVVDLRRTRTGKGYGAVTSSIRTYFGITMGILSVLYHLVFLVISIIAG